MSMRPRSRPVARRAVVLALGCALVLAACGGGDDDTQANDTGGDGSGPSTTAAPAGGAPAAAAYGDTACPPETGSTTPTIDFSSPFKKCLADGATYQAVIKTNLGSVTVDLDTTRTPATTNNFVALARSGYYDGTTVFRTEAQSGIIQGGSPHTQDNTDPGPGYTIKDEGGTFTEADYGPGTLAMARTQVPDSGSAQFFLLANENGKYLGQPGQPGAGTYVVFGKTSKGLDVLQKISALDDGSSTPSQPVKIESVTIRQTPG